MKGNYSEVCLLLLFIFQRLRGNRLVGCRWHWKTLENMHLSVCKEILAFCQQILPFHVFTHITGPVSELLSRRQRHRWWLHTMYVVFFLSFLVFVLFFHHVVSQIPSPFAPSSSCVIESRIPSASTIHLTVCKDSVQEKWPHTCIVSNGKVLRGFF